MNVIAIELPPLPPGYRGTWWLGGRIRRSQLVAPSNPSLKETGGKPGGRGGSPMTMIYTLVVSPKVARPRREEKGGKAWTDCQCEYHSHWLPPPSPDLPPVSFELGFDGATSWFPYIRSPIHQVPRQPGGRGGSPMAIVSTLVVNPSRNFWTGRQCWYYSHWTPPLPPGCHDAWWLSGSIRGMGGAAKWLWYQHWWLVQKFWDLSVIIGGDGLDNEKVHMI